MDWPQAVLSGDRRALARALTMVENNPTEVHGLLAELYRHSTDSHIVGITGPPGSGKSTLVNVLVQRFRSSGQTVGVLAIDPSSPFTHGAILGDRVRMGELSGDPGVFIRSVATRGRLGGLAGSTSEAAIIMGAAGFDRVLIETVGVGQSEVEIANQAHTTIVVQAPGLGDDVQAIKAGILEVADVVVVNKADLPSADEAFRVLRSMMSIGGIVKPFDANHGETLTIREDACQSPPPESTWQVPLLKTVAVTGEGLEGLVEQVDLHYAHLQSSGELVKRLRARARFTLEFQLRNRLYTSFVNQLVEGRLESLVDAVLAGETDPYAAADMLLEQ